MKALNVYIKIQNMFGSTEVQVDGENKKCGLIAKKLKQKIYFIHPNNSLSTGESYYRKPNLLARVRLRVIHTM